MIESVLINKLSDALKDYRQAITRTSDTQAKEDYLRLAQITEKVVMALRSEDIAQVKLGVLSFSRQVSDSFSMQPPEFKALATCVAEIRKIVMGKGDLTT
jgi:hypothetical protein